MHDHNKHSHTLKYFVDLFKKFFLFSQTSGCYFNNGVSKKLNVTFKNIQNVHTNRLATIHQLCCSGHNLELCTNLRQIPVLQYVTKCRVKSTEYHIFRTLLKHSIV